LPAADSTVVGIGRCEILRLPICCLLGNADEAISIIKRLIHITSFNSTSVGLMHRDPVWDPIRNDPRFRELVAEEKPQIR
jgi:hypothetical protein